MFENNSYQNKIFKTNASSNIVLLVCKSFFFMLLGLGITSLVSFGFSQIFINFINSHSSSESYNFMIGFIIGFGLLSAILSGITSYCLASRKSMILSIILSLLFCFVMGVFLATFVIFINWDVLGIAFGITALTFGFMALIGLLSKGRLNFLLYIASGLIFGSLILSLINLFINLANPGYITPIYWIVEFALLAGVMFLTIFDFNNIRKIAEDGDASTQTALLCAMSLYTDFIVIFIRFAYLLSYLRR